MAFSNDGFEVQTVRVVVSHIVVSEALLLAATAQLWKPFTCAYLHTVYMHTYIRTYTHTVSNVVA